MKLSALFLYFRSFEKDVRWCTLIGLRSRALSLRSVTSITAYLSLVDIAKSDYERMYLTSREHLQLSPSEPVFPFNDKVHREDTFSAVRLNLLIMW